MILDLLINRWIAEVRESFDDEARQYETGILNGGMTESMGILYLKPAVELYNVRMESAADTDAFNELAPETRQAINDINRDIVIIAKEVGYLLG